MNLNHIELPASTVAELYRSSLIIPAEKNKIMNSERVPDPRVSKWLGNNKKNILILVTYTECLHLPDKELELLTSMLTACKLSLEDVAIMNLERSPHLDFKYCEQQFEPAQMILFGIEPAFLQLPLSFMPFQVQPFHQTSFLFSPNLEMIHKDRALKTRLWESLKLLFKL